jgi:2-oxoacid:acceptor oxidoreductase gamma subunit (pyruvate/2-ketoisovalerate family)
LAPPAFDEEIGVFELRFHGRGGQGAVLAAKMLAAAFHRDGYRVQAFASYGGERRGAPVTSFLRIDRDRIRLRCMIYRPGGVILLDPALLESEAVTQGLVPGAFVLANTPLPPEALERFAAFRVATVDASGIARALGLGSATTPIVNTPILGAFAAVSERIGAPVSLEAVEKAVTRAVPFQKDRNLEGVRRAFASVRMSEAPRSGGTGASRPESTGEDGR